VIEDVAADAEQPAKEAMIGLARFALDALMRRMENGFAMCVDARATSSQWGGAALATQFVAAHRANKSHRKPMLKIRLCSNIGATHAYTA